jgi:hypothetical protein
MKYRKFSSKLYHMLSTKKNENYRVLSAQFVLFVCLFVLFHLFLSLFCFSVFQQNRFKDIYTSPVLLGVRVLVALNTISITLTPSWTEIVYTSLNRHIFLDFFLYRRTCFKWVFDHFTRLANMYLSCMLSLCCDSESVSECM